MARCACRVWIRRWCSVRDSQRNHTRVPCVCDVFVVMELLNEDQVCFAIYGLASYAMHVMNRPRIMFLGATASTEHHAGCNDKSLLILKTKFNACRG